MTPKETKKKYADAVTIDILELLQRDELGVFEFRRISQICGYMVPLMNSIGTPSENGQHGSSMRATEDHAPMLYSVLEGRTFDGNAALREKYRELQTFHTRLKESRLDIEEAQSALYIQEADLSKHRLLLEEQTKHIARERERLELSAGREGKHVELPPMPLLPADVEDSSDEDGEESEGGERDGEDSSIGGKELDAHIDEEWGREHD